MKDSQARQFESTIVSLCSPTPELTCFRCCPPIRPQHYDHLDYSGSVRRELMENRERYIRHGPRYKPIVGYHCWALGFLDEKGRRAGCLLHPMRNDGRDLRSLIDYGNKCERESCVPSREFASLPLEGRLFWLPLVEGLNAFLFSSPRSNPLFHILLWGSRVLEMLRAEALETGATATELLHRNAFLLEAGWRPRAHRYFLRLILESDRLRADTKDGNLTRMSSDILRAVHSLIEALCVSNPSGRPEGPFTHELPLEPDYLDFLRLGLDLRRCSFERAFELQKKIEQLASSPSHGLRW